MQVRGEHRVDAVVPAPCAQRARASSRPCSDSGPCVQPLASPSSLSSLMECVSNTILVLTGCSLSFRREFTHRNGGKVTPERKRITLVSYVGPVPGRRGRAAHDQARGGRSDRHDALARAREGAGGRQGDPQDDVQVRGPPRADEPGGVPVLPRPRARRRHPGGDDGSEPGCCARSTRCSRTRCRCSKPPTRWPRNGSPTPRSTACSPARCAPSPTGAARSSRPAFFWKLLSLEGVHPMLDGCARCGLDGDTVELTSFDLDEGGTLCRPCARGRGPGRDPGRARPPAAHARRRPQRRARRRRQRRVARGRVPRDPGARAPRRTAPALHRPAVTRGAAANDCAEGAALRGRSDRNVYRTLRIGRTARIPWVPL